MQDMEEIVRDARRKAQKMYGRRAKHASRSCMSASKLMQQVEPDASEAHTGRVSESQVQAVSQQLISSTPTPTPPTAHPSAARYERVLRAKLGAYVDPLCYKKGHDRSRISFICTVLGGYMRHAPSHTTIGPRVPGRLPPRLRTLHRARTRTARLRQDHHRAVLRQVRRGLRAVRGRHRAARGRGAATGLAGPTGAHPRGAHGHADLHQPVRHNTHTHAQIVRRA